MHATKHITKRKNAKELMTGKRGVNNYHRLSGAVVVKVLEVQGKNKPGAV